MDLPKVRGRFLTMPEGVILVARCPFCGSEHRYNKTTGGEESIDEIVARGFTDEWLPCQYDLPGNFWRIFVGRSRRRRKPGPAPIAASPTSPSSAATSRT
jgi:hypothetical protein